MRWHLRVVNGVTAPLVHCPTVALPSDRKTLTEPVSQVEQLMPREPGLDPVVKEWEQLRLGRLWPLVE